MIRTWFAGWDVRAEAGCGSPASQIIKRATEWGSDLIVLGSRGLSSHDNFLIGSIAQKVLHDAPCSVRIGRSFAERSSAPERILIGFDGTADSWAAVRAAAARAWPKTIQFRLLTAVGLVYPIGGMVPEVERSRLQEELHRAEIELLAGGYNVSSEIVEQDPKQALVEKAEAWKADALFLGASGQGLIGRLVLGSVSAAAAGRANCSVEVVRSVGRQ